ncbi:MAG: glycerate kinase [Paludibacteraceae bacterium]|nr:glycerate kinase [Paludibacteraceae bacterium]
MKIVVSPNAFKGSLTAAVAANVMAEAIRSVRPQADIVSLPIADGGDGTAEILSSVLNGTERRCLVHDPLMRPLSASYFLLDATTAIVGISSASGIALLQPSERSAMNTTTYGTGELIRHAIDHGVEHVIVALGGSATCDGGTGLAQALGVRFFDASDHELTQPACGAMLSQIARYEKPDTLNPIRFTILCDAEATMFGPEGAAYVYAPQKGATPEEVRLLDQSLRHYATVLNRQKSLLSIDTQTYAGAAGAAAATLKGILGGELTSGAEWVLHRVGFEHHVADADVVMTGEGAVDFQSVAGKGFGAILRLCGKHHLPIVTFVGRNALNQSYPNLTVRTITPADMPLAEAMKPQTAADNLYTSVQQYLQK